MPVFISKHKLFRFVNYELVYKQVLLAKQVFTSIVNKGESNERKARSKVLVAMVLKLDKIKFILTY